MEAKLLIITGMHRSGTSLITQWLYKCGLSVGDELMIPNKGNEQGYFEDMDFVQLHEYILRQHHLPDTGLTDKSLSQLASVENEIIKELLDSKSSRHNQWGWKDPRTCLFLHTYRTLLPQAKYLVIYRDCNFCVYSLINRMLKDEQDKYFQENENKKSAILRWKLYKKARTFKDFLKQHAEEYVKVWIHYNKELLHHIELLGDKQCIVADYHFLLANDNKLFGFLTSSWNFDLTHVPFAQVYNKKLMSTQAVIDPYIKNKSLLAEITELENKLKSYSFT